MGKKGLLFAIILLGVVFSCKKEKPKPEIAKAELTGSYYHLKKDNIKLFLPTSFEAFSEEDYGRLIDSLPESVEKTIERRRFNFLKYSKGSVYYFRDDLSATLICAKMMPYSPFTKKESSYLLGILSSSCSSYAEKTGANCKKITAGFSENYRTKVFRAIYEVTGEGSDVKNYNTIYFVTSNHKSFSLNIFSNLKEDYNPYIGKTVVN